MLCSLVYKFKMSEYAYSPLFNVQDFRALQLEAGGYTEALAQMYKCTHDMAQDAISIVFTVICSRNSKVVPAPTMKACRLSRGIAPLVLSLGTRWR
jgi:hypothetical protein